MDCLLQSTRRKRIQEALNKEGRTAINLCARSFPMTAVFLTSRKDDAKKNSDIVAACIMRKRSRLASILGEVWSYYFDMAGDASLQLQRSACLSNCTSSLWEHGHGHLDVDSICAQLLGQLSHLRTVGTKLIRE